MDLNELIALAADSGTGDDRIAALRTAISQSQDTDPRAVEQAALDAFNAAYAEGDFSVDDAPAIEVLADIVDAARQVAAARDQVKTSLADRAAALAKMPPPKGKPPFGKGKKNPNADDEEDKEDGGDDEDEEDYRDGTASEAVDGAPGEEGKPRVRGGSKEGSRGRAESGQGRGKGRGREEVDAEDDEDGGEPEQDGTENGATNEGQGGTTSNGARRRVTLSSQELNAQRGGQQKFPQGKPHKQLTITAGADTPNAPMGSQMTIKELAEAARLRMMSMPVGRDTEGEIRRSIGQINRIVDERFTVEGANPVRDGEIIDWVADEKRLPGGSLVAAAKLEYDNLVAATGGMMTQPTPPGDIWCSPSVTDYTLCPPLATRTGLLDLPSFQVQRGGIRYPVWKQFPEQRRPVEHGPGDKEISNDQAQGWYPSHMPAEDYPYDAQHVSDGPRHDWHGYVHTDANSIGVPPDLHDPDYFIKHPKKHIQGPCVEWAEERMHLAYLWIEEDILRNHTYPELAERFMSDALLNHAHYMNEVYIRWIVAHSDRLDPFWAGSPAWGGPGDPPRNGIVPPGPMSYPIPLATNNYYPGSNLDYGSYGLFGMGSAAEAVLERVGWLVTWFRNAYRMDFTTSLEGIAPAWFREFLKIDIERKLNRPHNLSVSNADVEAAFSAWGCRIQWVYDWQDMPSTEFSPQYDEVLSTHIMPRGGWPNSVDIVLYPAGSWVLAEQNILRIEATYDSNRLRNNKFTSLFMEDGWMLLNRCNRSFVVQLRGLCANGATGEPWQPCSPEAIPARREQLKTCDGGAKAPLTHSSGSVAPHVETPPPPKPPAGGDKPPAAPEKPANGNGNGKKK